MGIDNRVVGATITALRIRLGLTQQQLAASVNVSHQAVSKWENGAAIPDIQTLMALSQLFGVTMEQMLTGEIPQEEKQERAEPDASQDSEQRPSLRRWLRKNMPQGAYEKLEDVAEAVVKTAQDIGTQISENVANAQNRRPEEPSETEEPSEAEESEQSVCPEDAEKPEDPEDEEEDEDEDDDDDDDEDDEDDEDEDDDDDDDDEDDEDDAAEEENDGDAREVIDIDKVIAMAPFMTRGTLNELARRCAHSAKWSDLTRLAPFVSRDTLEALVKPLLDTKADKSIVCTLAPFLSSDTLIAIITQSVDDMDWDTVRRIAPFLKRETVDRLTILLATGEMPPEKEKSASGTNYSEVIGSAVNDIGSAVTEIGSSVRNALKSAMSQLNRQKEECEKRAEADDGALKAEYAGAEKPQTSELKDKIARAALASGNWTWLTLHACEVGDLALALEIGKAAASENRVEVTLSVAKLLAGDPVKMTELTDAVMEGEDWCALDSMRASLSADAADKILVRAVQREKWDVVRAFAPLASRAALEELTEKALQEENWTLLNAITSAV